MVGGEDKYKWMRNSKGLISPVKWHEPFGLALTESLYFASPVFGAPCGSLPEIMTSNVDFLSNKQCELAAALSHADQFDAQKCHDTAIDLFNSKFMAEKYFLYYGTVLNNNKVNSVAPKVLPPGKSIGDGWVG